MVPKRLLLWFLTITFHFSMITAEPEIKFTRDAFLDLNGRVYIQWTTNSTYLTMNLTSKSIGWIGVGFSPSPNMMGADIVICWVTEDGEQHLQDRHGLSDQNGRPPIDKHNDYLLLDASQNDTHTSCTFQRKLNTCDKEDYAIQNGTTQVIWAMNPEDPVDDTDEAPEYHGPVNRGVANVNFIGAQFKPDLKNLETMNLKLSNIDIPAGKDTIYWCKFFEIPKFDKQRYLVGFEPLIQKGNEMLVHHAVIYQCSGPNVEKEIGPLATGQGKECTSMADAFLLCQQGLIVWAVGGKGDFFPSYTGFPFGSTENSKIYYVLDMHYNNPAKTQRNDSSGFKLYYTSEPKEYEASLLTIGVKIYLPYLVIPPQQKEHVVVAHCSPECLKTNFPETGIKVFGGVLHTHTTGRKLRVRHFRNGIELPYLFQNDHYNFDYQQSILLEKEVTILPTDELTLECTYNSLGVNETVLGGLATTDEMCEVYLYYYPRMGLSRCFSIMNSSDVLQIVGVDAVYPTKSDLDKIIIKEPPSFANMSLVDFLHSYKWTQSQVDTLQMLEYTSLKVPQCRNENGLIQGLAPVNYSDATPYIPPDVCKSN